MKHFLQGLYFLLVCGFSWSVHATAALDVFTEKEQSWIAEQAPVTLCVDPDWLPYEKIDDTGKHIGIAADYFKLFGDYTGLQFRLVPTQSWSESEAFAKSGKCQILTFLNKSDIRSEFLDFTSPYLTSPIVIVATADVSYVDGLKSLGPQSVSMVKNYIYRSFLEQDYPHIPLVEVNSSDEALLAVSEGRVDATIGSLYIISERIQRLGLSNLKIVGPTEYRHEFRVGVIKGEEQLLAVMEKAVNSVGTDDELDIINRWVRIKYEMGYDYSLAVMVGLVSFLIFIMLGYRSFVLTRYNRKLSDAYTLLEMRTDELDRLSHTDALTGIHNRLRLDGTITSELNRFKRYRDQFSVMILDIDHFKRVNDTYGHPIGDRVLIDLCGLVQQQLRSTDVFGRWGGEEFLIVCPSTSMKEAILIAEKLRKSVDEFPFETIGHLTVSFGVTTIHENDGEKELVSRADEQLYRAKSEGRNRVCHD